MSRESQIGFLLICFPLLHYYGFLTPTWGPAQRQPVLEISPFAAQEARTLFAQKRSIISSPNAAFRSLSSRAKLENCALGMQCLSMLGRGRQLKKGKFIRAGIRMRKEQLDEDQRVLDFAYSELKQ